MNASGKKEGFKRIDNGMTGAHFSKVPAYLPDMRIVLLT